jgi:hypothetical protein
MILISTRTIQQSACSIAVHRHKAFATTKIATYNVASQHSPVKIDKATCFLIAGDKKKKVAGFFFVPGARFPRAAPRLLVS